MAGDTVWVRSRILEAREKVIIFVHEMFNGETGELAATARYTGVHIDRATRKSCPFPAEIRARLADQAR